MNSYSFATNQVKFPLVDLPRSLPFNTAHHRAATADRKAVTANLKELLKHPPDACR